VRDTSDSFRGTSDDLRLTLQKLNEMLNENRKGIKTAIEQANSILVDTRDIIGDETTKKNLRSALEQLPQMIKDTHDTVQSLQQTVQLVDRNLRNVEGFTKPLGDRGAVLISNLEKGTRNLDALVSDMTVFTDKLNSSEGTVGLLMNDPQLYQHLNHAAKNIDDITRELKPIVDDARVFSDKIARHPEDLGARGLITKKPGLSRRTAGYPLSFRRCDVPRRRSLGSMGKSCRFYRLFRKFRLAKPRYLDERGLGLHGESMAASPLSRH